MSANNVNEINDQVASILGISDAPIANAPVLVLPAPLPPVANPVQVAAPVVAVPVVDSVVSDDHEAARKHLHNVLINTKKAIDELMVVASQSQSARSYEVLNQLLNTQRATARELLALEADRQKVTNTNPIGGKGNTHIDKAVFVGTNADLLKLLKKGNSEDAPNRDALDAEFSNVPE